MTRLSATCLGFFVASLIPALLGAIFSPAAESISTVVGLLPVFYFFSALATAFLGVPSFVVLNHFDLVRWWTAVGAGIAIGALVAVIVLAPNTVDMGALSTMAGMGGLSSLAFWSVWRLGR